MDLREDSRNTVDMNGKVRLGAAILAGGTGARVGGAIPKQFLPVGGVPVIIRTVRTFKEAGFFDNLVVAIHPDWIDRLREMLGFWGIEEGASLSRSGSGGDALLKIVPGGPTRQSSSWAAIQTLAGLPHPPDAVLVHDAARCLADIELLRRCVEGLRQYPAVTAAVGAVDTLAEAEGGCIVAIPDRGRFFRLQTPQGFHLEVIVAAHRAALQRGLTDASDDTQLVLSTGGKVHLVEGSETNLKISHLDDFAVADRLAGKMGGSRGGMSSFEG